VQRGPGEAVGVDADGVDDRPHTPAGVGEAAIAIRDNAEDLAHAFQERPSVAPRLKADDIEAAHGTQQVGRARQSVQDRRRHERRVQKEAEPIAHALTPQVLAKREQVVVVHPHQIVAVQQRRERCGKLAVHAAVAFVVLALVVHQPEAEMQQRP